MAETTTEKPVETGEVDLTIKDNDFKDTDVKDGVFDDGKEEIENALIISGAEEGEAVDALLAEKLVAFMIPETDDPSAPHLSLRALLMGTFWCAALSFPNNILAFRTNSIAVDSSLANLLAYPMGVFCAAVLPTRVFSTFGYKWTFNPGPFTIKEHVLISVMANAGYQGDYGNYNLVGQYFKKELGYMGNTKIDLTQAMFFGITLNLLGFGCAGLMRRFLIYPKAMMWPTNLPTIGLFITLHKAEEKIGRWVMSRLTFFWIALAVIFVYEFIPNYIAPVLQSVALLCLFTQNDIVRFLGSTASQRGGPGILSLTFDWQYIGASALTQPWPYQLNIYIGMIVWLWIAAPILYYQNPWNHPKLYLNSGDVNVATGTTFPQFNSNRLFDKTGKRISASSLYDTNTYDLNITKYDLVKPIYLSELFVLNYMSWFMALGAMFTHVGLWYGKDIYRQLKNMIRNRTDEVDSQDIHSKLMSEYKEVPDWLYGAWLLFWTVVMIIIGHVTEFKIEWWSTILAVVISNLLLIPTGIIYALTGVKITMNVFQEYIAGLLLEGQTVPVMTWKSIGTTTQIQGLLLLSDLKIGHYLHIPPWSMFIAQIWGSLLGGVLAIATTWWMMIQTGIDLGNDPLWQATGFLTFNNAGAIWGAIAPRRFWGSASIYWITQYGWLIGFLGPFIPWGLNKLRPSKFWHFVNVPILCFTGAYVSAGYYQNYITVPFLIGYVFQNFLLHRAQDWWQKYNYSLAAAISTGTAAAVLLATAFNANNVYFPYWALNPGSDTDYYCYGLDWTQDIYGDPAF